MSCAVNQETIRRGIIEKALQKGLQSHAARREGQSLLVEASKWPIKGQSFGIADSIVKSINAYFGDLIASQRPYTGGQEITVNPTQNLVQTYLDHYTNSEAAKERASLNQEANIEEEDGEIEVPSNYQQLDINGEPIRIYC